MTRRLTLWLSLFIFLAACEPGSLGRETPAVLPNPISDYASLLQAFQAEGFAVEPGEEVADPVFSVKSHAINLARGHIQVMEYPFEVAARAEAANISSDGFRVGNSMVDWVDAPHFFRAGRLIVLYVGRDKPTLDLLARVLGPQFAGISPNAPTPTIEYAPTVLTSTPAPTFDATPDPRTPTMIPMNEAIATMAARATTSPFPTARAAAIVPGKPASATTGRDGLSLTVQLPGDHYLTGEGARADIMLRNDSADTIWINSGTQAAQLMLLDEQGHEPAPYPWYTAPRPGMLFTAPLLPGATMTATIPFNLPPTNPASGHRYALWAWTQFSRSAPENGNGPDNIWLRLETGPIQLILAGASPAQHLTARLEANQNGWRVSVADSQGKTPEGPMWGMLEANTYGGFYSNPLPENAQGEWSGTWEDNMKGNEKLVRVWVSAPGYVTAIANAMVPGNRSGQTMFDTLPPPRRVLPSLDAAQAAVKLPLARPRPLPPGARLDRVEVDDTTYDSNRRTFVSQVYQLSNGEWLELTQMNWTDRFEGAGWGQARYDPEAQQTRVSGAAAYLSRQFDWWFLDWKVGDVGFELHAPVQALSIEELLRIAASVKP